MAEFALIADTLFPLAPNHAPGIRETVSPTPAVNEPTDEELLRRVASRNGASVAALEGLFLRHAGPLGGFLRGLLREDSEAEDLVHDAFIRVAEKAATFREESSFRTWLFSLALNLARTRCRRVALKERTEEKMMRSRPAGTALENASDPVWSAQQRELRMRVDRAIATLAEPEREVFLLYWFGKLPYAEITQLTGVSVPAAKMRVHRALARLGEQLEEFR